MSKKFVDIITTVFCGTALLSSAGILGIEATDLMTTHDTIQSFLNSITVKELLNNVDSGSVVVAALAYLWKNK